MNIINKIISGINDNYPKFEEFVKNDLFTNKVLISIYTAIIVIAFIYAMWDEIKYMSKWDKEHTKTDKKIQKTEKTQEFEANQTQNERKENQ